VSRLPAVRPRSVEADSGANERCRCPDASRARPLGQPLNFIEDAYDEEVGWVRLPPRSRSRDRVLSHVPSPPVNGGSLPAIAERGAPTAALRQVVDVGSDRERRIATRARAGMPLVIPADSDLAILSHHLRTLSRWRPPWPAANTVIGLVSILGATVEHSPKELVTGVADSRDTGRSMPLRQRG